MPILEIDIDGNASGLGGAANQALGILENLQNVANELKLDLFKATDVVSLNAIGNTLTNVTGQIKTYTSAAIEGSKAFQDQTTSAILDTLNTKLTVLSGTAQLFGTSVKNQREQVSAYESAIRKLLANGIDPLDSRVTNLSASIIKLNESLNPKQIVNIGAQYQATGAIFTDLEDKIKNLKKSLSTATDERSITQYNIRLRTAQDELLRLRNLGVIAGDTLTNSANKAASAARKLSLGYNGVATEFGRIIQDAPFAVNNFGAIGNNITRLAELVPGYRDKLAAIITAQGGVVTSGALLKAGLGGLVSGFGGITLAISAVVSAHTFYQQYVQKAERDTKKLTGANLEYIETLRGVERAQLQGAKSAQEELTQLRILYGIYQDVNKPLLERKSAYEQLHKLQPEVFLKYEGIAADTTKKAYNELTESILASARARAAVNLITKNSERLLDNESKLIKLQIALDKATLSQQKLNTATSNASTAYGGGAAIVDAQNEAAKKTEIARKRVNDVLTDSNLLLKENNRLEEAATKNLKIKGATLVDLGGSAKPKSKASKNDTDRITPKITNTDNSAELAGLVGNDIEVTKIKQKYEAVYQAIKEAATKKGADLTKLGQQRSQAEINEAIEIGQVIIAEKERVANEIQRIQNDSGVKSSEGRAKELAQIEKWYDAEVVKANGSISILAAIEEGKQAQLEAVREKYRKKQIDAEQALVDKIEKITDEGFISNDNHTKKATDKINEQLKKRLDAVSEYFTELKALYKGDPLATAVFGITELKVKKGITDKANTAIDGGLSRELSKAAGKFGVDLFNTLTTFNQQADRTFANLLGSLAKNLTDSLNNVFLSIFQKKLTDILNKAFDGMESSSAGLAGAAIAIGSIVSGLFKKTSSGGQALGGALKGAGTGALLGSVVPGIGTAVGAVVGGLVGAVGGVFGASKAKKEEELQRQQLEEQKKQTALMERQNALAYTASIIGRMTTQGVVTGVEVNAFGQLETRIQGQDLIVVLDRANNARKRGA